MAAEPWIVWWWEQSNRRKRPKVMLLIGCSLAAVDIPPVLPLWSRIAAGKTTELRSHFATPHGKLAPPWVDRAARWGSHLGLGSIRAFPDARAGWAAGSAGCASGLRRPGRRASLQLVGGGRAVPLRPVMGTREICGGALLWEYCSPI